MDSMATNAPVMISFGHHALHSFFLKEVEMCDTLGKLLDEFGPDTWSEGLDCVSVKVSSSRNGSYDKFNLQNTVCLVMKILKTDVLWIVFDKPVTVSTVPTRNAFDVLRGASDAKTLPEKIKNPVNEKAALFNEIIEEMKEKNVSFSVNSCAPRIKNRKTGAATELVYNLTNIVWKISQCESQLKTRSLWNKLPDLIIKLTRKSKKRQEGLQMSQQSSKAFATEVREIANIAIMAKSELLSFKVALLGGAQAFDDYADFLKAHAESTRDKRKEALNITTAAEAICVQIANREKFSLLEKGSKPLTHPVLVRIFEKLKEEGPYKPVNIAVMLPTDKNLRSYLVNKALPHQAPERVGLWTFDNTPAPQSLFCFLVELDHSQEEILQKVQMLKSDLQTLQKFFYPREFYHQFNEQLGLVTGISPQMLKLVSSMIMGDSRKHDGEVRERFEEAVMSGDPDFIYDMRHFNGRDIQFRDFLNEFRAAVEEYMVEDRGRHEQQYDGTVISNVSFGFSMKSIFKEICKKVELKFPGCPMPQSEAFLYRYLIPRTKAAAEAACRSEALVPLKLSMQQKVIEKPNVDAHFNAAHYKYVKNFAVELGEAVTMIGWDDKTGVDIGDPEQPTAATQNSGKSWVQSSKPVGEGQHSFHTTNLCPSVRLVHEVPSSMDGSFYRGLPQVCIKDAIFQHSTSSRHATELYQMFLSKPELLKPVLVITNDGGVDHTIRHERNIIAMVALFLHCPEVLLLINFQMAAYRSAYHPVEKVNCILNLAWNGVSCSRATFSDPVLEKAFSSCGSMSDVRKMAEKHPGLKEALGECLHEPIEVLENRAKQASLKGNDFEVFKPATDVEIREFLGIISEIDAEFDVEKYLDKSKTYHYSPKIKDWIDQHITFTYYSVTIKRFDDMSVESLNEKFPEVEWNVPLKPITCPIVDKDDPEKFISYEQTKNLLEDDFSDKCRPGKTIKTPSNIPFVKNKQRALYGAKIEMVCAVCRKKRAAYIQYKPTQDDVLGIKRALSDVKYVCGGRISSFGRSLAVLEEVTNIKETTANDEGNISNDNFGEDAGKNESVRDELYSSSDEGSSSNDNFGEDAGKNASVRDELFSSSDEGSSSEESLESNPLGKSFRTTSSELDMEVSTSAGLSSSSLPRVRSGNPIFSSKSTKLLRTKSPDYESQESSGNGFCDFCGKFKTSHKCRVCSKRCCNFCNKMEVDDLKDILCPLCDTEMSNNNKTGQNDEKIDEGQKVMTGGKGRGRPKKPLDAGHILIPLNKRGRGRPPTVKKVAEV